MSELETILRELGRDLDYPAMHVPSSAVIARLDSVGRTMRFRRLALVAVSVGVVALATASLAVSGVRKAIFDWFGFAGERIEFVQTLPPLDHSEELALGTGAPVTLAEAQRRLPHPAPVPALEGLGPPSAVRLRQDQTDLGPVLRLSLLWGGPRAYRLLYSVTPQTHLRGGRQRHLVLKRLGTDFSANKPTVWADVNGHRALWIPSPHQYIYTLRSGSFSFLSRRARNVLLWQNAHFFFRLEGRLTLEQALTIARSVR